MIATPICDFVRTYAQRQPARLHMPGHKGAPLLGFEPWDITEIDGADNLYAPQGIIAESEANASRLFGAKTFYSAEGSSLAIRAMLYLAVGGASRRNTRPRILAGRNAHRVFAATAALLDFDIEWLHPGTGDAYHCCAVAPRDVAATLDAGPGFDAVYLTSPDYLGNIADVAGIAAECRRRNVPLLVDNAHGAYLKFLSPSRHPIDLGADMCCDSAHKTLPAVTGGAYLHIRADDPNGYAARARDALALFGSSSPSWLILQSLDRCNPCLEELPARLSAFIPKVEALKAALRRHGWALRGDEPMKLTIEARPFGYTGDALAQRLTVEDIFCEFHDPDFLTLMLTPENSDGDLRRLEAALLAVPRQEPLEAEAPEYQPMARAMSVREACFAGREALPISQCEGRVLAGFAVSCPPCVPIVMCGERIDAAAIARFRYYGVESCEVVKE